MNSKVTALFKPLDGKGPLKLKHRIALAPLTRNRGSEPDLCPHQLHVDYYSQRATDGGLLVTEAVSISPEAVGYVSVPGIWTNQQMEAWKKVTEAVHKKGAVIFMQLWHTGRISSPSFAEHPLIGKGPNKPGVSASAVPIAHPKTKQPIMHLTYKGQEPHSVPRPLEASEIPRLCQDYVKAAKNAMLAGFDGVEVHAAHGYLIDQFIVDGVNKRTDSYGGSIENRCRLLFEVCDAVQKAVGPFRLAVRLSPTTIDPKTGKLNHAYFSASCTDPDAVYEYAVRKMNDYNLAYLFLSEARWATARTGGDVTKDEGELKNTKYRKMYHGTIMAAGGFTPRTAAEAVEKGYYDIVAFGRWFISNPDLPERIKHGLQLNVYDRNTFYSSTHEGGGADGYTDYPDAQGSVGVVGKYKLIDQDNIGRTLATAKL